MEEHDLPDRQQLPECEVAHEPEEHAAPNGTRRTSNRQTHRPAHLEDNVTES
jgi:hypothetical protein